MAKREGVITEDDDDNGEALRNPTGDGEAVKVEQQAKKDEAAEDVQIIEGEPPQAEAEEDEPLDVGGEDEGQERHRPRETAKERRERAKRSKNRDRNEIQYLRTIAAQQQAEVAQLRQTIVQSTVQNLESQLRQTQQEALQFEEIRKAAAAANKVEDALAAEQVRQEAMRRAESLNQQLQYTKQNAASPAPRVQDPRTAENVREFLTKHPWYNANSDDTDSVALKSIDKIVATQYNPATKEYWNELEKRAKAVIPHRFSDDADPDDEGGDEPPPVQTTAKTRKGPPVGGGNKGSAPSQRGGEIYLPPAYVANLKEAGLWEDPKVRAKMAKAYVERQRQLAAG